MRAGSGLSNLPSHERKHAADAQTHVPPVTHLTSAKTHKDEHWLQISETPDVNVFPRLIRWSRRFIQVSWPRDRKKKRTLLRTFARAQGMGSFSTLDYIPFVWRPTRRRDNQLNARRRRRRRRRTRGGRRGQGGERE